MRIVAIIQARMGSTRLPGKVLMNLAGEPMLYRVVRRSQRAAILNEVVVATTTKLEDEGIAKLCFEHGWPCFRGSGEDVLDRYYHASIARKADVVVRLTSDCPLIEPMIVDRVVWEFLERQPEIDYACNIFPRRTFPHGLDTEVMHFDILEQAWREDVNPAWREHVTPYIQRNPDLFNIHCVENDADYSHMRWTVDTAEDMAFVSRIYNHFGHDCFTWLEALAVLKQHPQWLEINRHVKQKVI